MRPLDRVKPYQRLAHRRASARPVQLKLYPALPDSRIAAAMKNCKNNHRILANPEIHRIWEAARDCTSNIAKYDWIARGCDRSSGDRLLNLNGKFLAKPGALLVVTDRCILKLVFRSAGKRREASSPQARSD